MNKPIINGEVSQDLIREKLVSDEPCLIGRFGITEFRVLHTYVYKKSKYPNSLKNLILRDIYPYSKESIDKFSKMLLELTPNIDILAAWRTPEEAKYCEEHCNKNTEFILASSLDGITFEHPWTSVLKGKKVLVINPLAESIKRQYAKRELLFENKDTLPEFELMTMKPVYVTKENIPMQPYSSWFEALDTMKKEIETYDFDIAIIGAGPFGIFLAEHCKKLGKKAITVCGATQLIFGIMGKRWKDGFPKTYALMNEHWVWPSDDEKPEGFKNIEGGCYW